MFHFEQYIKSRTKGGYADKSYHFLLEQIRENHLFYSFHCLLEFFILECVDTECLDVVVKFFQISNLLTHAIIIGLQVFMNEALLTKCLKLWCYMVSAGTGLKSCWR